MKLGRLLIAGLFAGTAISTSAHAGIGFLAERYSVHKVQTLTLKTVQQDGTDLKKETVKAKDVEALLCGAGGPPDKSELVIAAPCPLFELLEGEEDVPDTIEGIVALGVWDLDRGDNGNWAVGCAIDACEYYNTVFDFKDGVPKRAQGFMECGSLLDEEELLGGWLDATVIMDIDEVKKTDTPADGRLCFSKVKTKSIIGGLGNIVGGGGYYFGRDIVVEKGNFKAGKVKTISTEIFEFGIPGPVIP